jgi:hypothetical protein
VEFVCSITKLRSTQQAAMKECGYQEIDHPTYNPLLASSNYYLVRPEYFGYYNVLDD